MVTVPKPVAGQPAGPVVLDAEVWSNLIDIINSWQAGEFGPRAARSRRKGVLLGKNTSGVSLNRGTVQQLGSLQDPGNANVQKLHEYKPIISLIDPIWNFSMDDLVILPCPFEDQAIRAVNSNDYVPVTLFAPPGSYRWAHIDPLNPTLLKAGTGGPFKIIGDFSDNTVIIDTREYQPLWNYRIKTDGDLTDVELQNLDGTVFAISITLLTKRDSSSFKADDVGACLNIGSEFYDISGDGGFNCEDLCDCQDFLPAAPNFV